MNYEHINIILLYRLPFLPFFRRFFLLLPTFLAGAAPCGAAWLNFPGAIASGVLFCLEITGVRFARSFRNVSNRDANCAPSAPEDWPPAEPMPKRPSTNFSPSNCDDGKTEATKTKESE